MKVLLVCPQCTPPTFNYATANSTSIYDFVCKAGHKNYAWHASPDFELLFDIGLNAIVDGYHREAVSSFASALERFREFCVQVHVAGEKHVAHAEFISTWKEMASLSERQLGAYCYAHLLRTGKHPDTLKSQEIKFRNDVVHKGKIPTKKEAIDFGQKVLNLIDPELEDIKLNFENQLDAAYHYHLEPRLKLARERRGPDQPALTILGYGALRFMMRYPLEKITVVDHLRALQQHRVALTGGFGSNVEE